MLCEKGDLIGGAEGELTLPQGGWGTMETCSGLEGHVGACWAEHAKTGTPCR